MTNELEGWGWTGRARNAPSVVRRRIAVVAAIAVALSITVLGTGGTLRAGEPRIQRSPEFTKRVDAAIGKGVSWLKSQQQPDGAFTKGFGEGGEFLADVERTSLVHHVLRVCKVPLDDPVMQRAFDCSRKCFAKKRDWNKETRSHFGTEELGHLCLMIAGHGQVSGSADATGEPTYSLEVADKAWMKELVVALEKAQLSEGWWPLYVDVHEAGDTDLGASFTALVGLQAAHRSGVPVKPETWTKAQRFFLGKQVPKGTALPAVPGSKEKPRARGFDFNHKSGDEWFCLDSDTADGVTSLAICRSALLAGKRADAAKDVRTEAAIRDGLAHLGVETHTLDTLRKNDDVCDYSFEHVYRIERAADMTGAERLGSLDWYGVGAEAVVALQGANGAWHDKKPDNPGNDADVRLAQRQAVDATCYALLFLARGTPPAPWTVTAGSDDADIHFAAAPALPPKDFEDFLDLVLSRWRRNADAAVKERLFAKTVAVGPKIVPSLVRRLASEKPDERVAAIALLERATGERLGYDAAASDDDRAAAVARWQAWWKANGEALRYDSASGRLTR